MENLISIDQEQALNLCKFFINAEQNIFLFGRRGIGKSYIALQAAKECKYKVNYINLSVIERSDLCGYPSIFEDGDVITFKSPYFLPKLNESDSPDSVILFDEVDKAPPEVTAPLLEILQFRKVNGKKINAASCLLTGNLIGENVHSNQISSALLDRGAKYILNFNFERWLEWAKANEVHDLIIGFLRNNCELACGKIIDGNNYASPSPRGWTQASEALIKANSYKIYEIETITQIIAGFVGSEAGTKFKIWYEYFRKFEPYVHSYIDKGEMNFSFEKLMLTEKVVFVISACYFAKQRFLSDKKFIYLENLCKLFVDYKVDPELQLMGLHNSFDFDMIAKHKLYTCNIFFDLFKKINEKAEFIR